MWDYIVPSTNSEMIQMGDKSGTNISPTPSYADIVKGKGTNGSESKTPFENQWQVKKIHEMLSHSF